MRRNTTLLNLMGKCPLVKPRSRWDWNRNAKTFSCFCSLLCAVLSALLFWSWIAWPLVGGLLGRHKHSSACHSTPTAVHTTSHSTTVYTTQIHDSLKMLSVFNAWADIQDHLKYGNVEWLHHGWFSLEKNDWTSPEALPYQGQRKHSCTLRTGEIQPFFFENPYTVI